MMQFNLKTSARILALSALSAAMTLPVYAASASQETVVDANVAGVNASAQVQANADTGGFTQGAKDIGNGIKDLAVKAKDGIETGAEKTVDAGKDAAAYVGDKSSAAWDKTKEVSSNVANKTISGTEAVADKVEDKSSAAWDKTKEVSSKAASKTKAGAEKTASKVKEKSGAAWDKTKATAAKVEDKAKTTTSNIKQKLTADSSAEQPGLDAGVSADVKVEHKH
jgi:hypothetical protein